jgi:thymidylate kinase
LWWVRGVKIVIFDRFYLDALIDAMYTCRCVDRVFLRLFLAMQSKVSRAVVLDVDVDTAISRKKDIISRREVKIKRKLYIILAKALSIPIIDARQNLSQVLSNTCKVVGLECN